MYGVTEEDRYEEYIRYIARIRDRYKGREIFWREYLRDCGDAGIAAFCGKREKRAEQGIGGV